MTGNNASGAGDPPTTLVGHWDRLCDLFEDDWRSGRSPRIEDYLGEMPAPGRPALFRELLGVELSYRKARGERSCPDEYEARFPGFAAAVRGAFEPTEPSAEPPTLRRIGRLAAGLELLSGPPSLWLDLIGSKVLPVLRRGVAATSPQETSSAPVISDSGGRPSSTHRGGEWGPPPDHP